ncbi:serine hydrolase domain-containing protein [Millisia brevis]|uniref:serine hydrolase domain-containing protein n=1 Tax=Millisia brevis TaxID=264148 RepID=UPI000AD9EF7E|nr:serine hydrolase domain-containing protein [Millisia brevis]
MTAPTVTRHHLGNTVSPKLDGRLTRVLERYVERGGRRRAMVHMVDGAGARRWSAAVADVPLDPTASFFIASVTKRFVITLVLQACERGEIELAAPIDRYLPAEDLAGLHVLRGVDRTGEITVHHLAGHTSGLPDFFDKRTDGTDLEKDLVAGRDSSWTYRELLAVTRDRQHPHFPPQDLTASRPKARYSDTGFQLLIRILETVTGRTFAQLLAERIAEPLDLAGTYLPRAATASDPAPTDIYGPAGRVDLPGMVASSNDLVSTTDDLLVFERALVAGRLFRGAETVGLLTDRTHRLRNIPILTYGLGTMVFTAPPVMSGGARPLRLIGHSGVTGSWLFSCPARDVHLAGTVDRVGDSSAPFALMLKLLQVWGSH